MIEIRLIARFSISKLAISPDTPSAHSSERDSTSIKLSPDTYINADDLMKNGVLIGCHQGLSEEQFAHVQDVSNDKYLKLYKQNGS